MFFDFSHDGKVLRSNDQAGEIRFWSIFKNVGEIKPRDLAKTIIWATQTCPLRWSSSGMWNSEAKYRDVNTTDFLKSSNARNILEEEQLFGETISGN